jgi:(2R)-3-sulfolactate dehydrogenase (NADP+)
MIIAIDPAAFGPGAMDRFAAMAGLIEGMDGARLPGRRRQALAREIERDGIAVDQSVLDEIAALGQ